MFHPGDVRVEGQDGFSFEEFVGSIVDLMLKTPLVIVHASLSYGGLFAIVHIIVGTLSSTGFRRLSGMVVGI